MPGEIGMVLQLILKLLPILKPSEVTQLKGELKKIEEEWNETKQTLLKAIEDGDMGAINTILAHLLDLSED